MPRKPRWRTPSPALVVALIALFVALGGTSYAAIKLPKNSVGTKQLKKGAVTAVKLKRHAVTAAKIDTAGLVVPSATHAISATNVGGLSAGQLQRRITGACSAASAIRAVGGGGTVTCQSVGTTVLWAVVTANGTIARSSGPVTVTHSTGTYVLVFNRSVTNCAYSATVGPAGTGIVKGDANVASLSGGADGVLVETFAPGGTTSANLPFHLIVAC
jgi:hypothetical protein